MSWLTASQSGNSNSFTKELFPSSRAHTIVDPPAPAVLQQNTPIAAPLKNTGSGYSTWGSRLSHRLTPLSRTQISETALKATTSAQPSPGTPLHHERQLKTSNTSGSSAPPANTDHAQLLNRCARATICTSEHAIFLFRCDL